MNKYFTIALAILICCTMGFAVFHIERPPVLYAKKYETLSLPQQVSNQTEQVLQTFEKATAQKDRLLSAVEKYAPLISDRVSQSVERRYSDYADKKQGEILSNEQQGMPYIFTFYAPMEDELKLSLNGEIVVQEGRNKSRYLIPVTTQSMCIQTEKTANLLIESGNGIQLLAVGPTKQCWSLQSSGIHQN